MAYPQKSFLHTVFDPHSFCARKREVVYSNTLLYQLDVLKETGRYDAFKLQWHPSYADEPDIWPVPNHLFWDSDVAKWIEGACYFLKERINDVVDAAVKELVQMIRQAQQPDGYLNIHFTVVEPDKRFTDLRDLHELYNAGHLIEAALAHNYLYHNDELLEPIITYVDLLCKTFGPGPEQKHGYPGHPEIELALLRLYSYTRDPKHLALARYFLDERGNPVGVDGRHYYDVEAEARGERRNERPDYFPKPRSYWYQQAHKPIIEQETIEGHSVRAMYLLTAVADLVRVDEQCNPKAYRAALQRLWSNMVEKKMYVTGGIGAMKQWEGFGIDYFLPQSTDEGGCYSETCAAIGVMMLAERLLQLDLNAQYSDTQELCFYNAILSGMSTNGRQFTYTNPLASSTFTNPSTPSKRSEWFTCACCPPNLTRLLGYLGGYFWTFDADAEKQEARIQVHMYGSARLRFEPFPKGEVVLVQRSNWPWGGDVFFELKATKEMQVGVALRIPRWAGGDWELSPPLTTPPNLKSNYLHLPPTYLKAHPQFRLSILMTPRFLTPHPYTNQNTVALARGPIIYCLEDVDNDWVDDDFKSLTLTPTKATITESLKSDPQTQETYVGLTVRNGISLLDGMGVGMGSDGGGEGKEMGKEKKKKVVEELRFVPYYYRANRGGRGVLRVGVRRG
ncbi:MAG: hypothetical protein M1834_009478 [Cirrosporium novae-zelandiae]|nr:MAG: hypothetical protein M1834_009478 [Cirrosporium novae-zelandiae]